MMAYSEDHIALAAEYALGTLDADERAQVETMMAVDTEFTAIVHAWEYRLGVLNQMVGSVEPRPIVWENIRAADRPFRRRRRRWCCPKRRCRPPPVAPVDAEAAAATAVRAPTVRTSSSCRAGLRRWRNVASFATALAAALSRCWRCRSISRICCRTASARSRARRWSRSRRRRRRPRHRRNMSRCCSGTAARPRSS